jgi:adenylate cyclase
MAEPHLHRRLAAILAADVVGYSRMMEADESGTMTRLKTLRADVFDPTTARMDGRIFKNTGDGALVEFGSAFGAVQCAVEVQRALAERNAELPEDQQIVLRIGISLGDVIVDGEDLFGNGVNVAARMEALANPGEACISGNVYEHVASTLDFTFEDLGEQTIKGIDRPIRAYRLVSDAANLTAQPVARADTPLELPDKPSIAVLPFENMSRDPEQDFFADGMAEDIITELSRYRSLFVIARNSSFAFKGQSPDLRDVSRDLGVRYVLEGSIRKASTRIRVTAQLIEGTTGSHIWAERYDRELDDIFALQDEITETIVAAIGPEIDQVERERAQRLPPDNLDAWESYQRGLWHLYRFNKEDNAEAQRLFRLAIRHAPNFSPAHSGLTHALYFSFMHGHAEDRPTVLAEAFEAGRNAVACDERDADAHFALGRILNLKNELDAAIAEFEAAIAYNPNFAHSHHGLGTALTFSGQWKPALESYERAIRLSPHDPLLWLFLTAKALTLLCEKRLDQAEETARQSIRLQNAAVSAHYLLASTLGHLGKVEEAQKVMAEVFRMKMGISADHITQTLPFKNPADVSYIIEGLHKAGMPQ